MTIYKNGDNYIEIQPEIDPLNPRKEFDHLGTMVCWHNNYVLGDEQPSESPEDWKAGLDENAIVLPLYLMDHGGLWMRLESFQ